LKTCPSYLLPQIRRAVFFGEQMNNHMMQHENRGVGYVYIARNNGLIKIGGTHNVGIRMSQLRVKNRFIKLIAYIKADKYMYMEKFIHSHLKHLQVENEWYKDSEEIISAVIDFVKKHGELFGAQDINFVDL
jgi:type II secretory pathway component PulL